MSSYGAHKFNNAFYCKVAGLGFGVGACMELFMVKTGFYNTVTRVERERLDDFVLQKIELEKQGKTVPLRWPGQENQE